MKKTLSFLLVLAMLMSLCSFSLAADKDTVKILAVTDVGATTDDVLIINELEKRTGLNIEMTLVNWPDYDAKQNVTISSGDLPDIMTIHNDPEIIKYGDQGAFINLYDYKEQLPNLFKYYDKYEAEYSRKVSPDTGALYGVYCIYDFPYGEECLMLRKDIVEEVGYKVEDIKSIDDLTKLLYAMKEAYPESIPMQGTWGLSYATNIGRRAHGIGSFGMYYDFVEKQYKYGGVTEDAHEIVSWYRKLIEDGIFNPNLDLQTEEFVANLYNDKAFVIYYYANEGSRYNTAMKHDNPKFEMTAIRMPSFDEKPTYPLSAWSVYSGWGHVITSVGDNLEGALKLVDYLYSDEGRDLLSWGIEGVTYEVDADGNKKYTSMINTPDNPDAEERSKIGLHWILEIMGVYPFEAFVGVFDEPTVVAMENAMMDTANTTEWPYMPWTAEENEARAVIETPLGTYVNEQLALFITGDRDIAEWDDFVAEAKGMGVEELEAMYNEKLAANN